MLKGTAAFIPIARSQGSSAAAFMIETFPIEIEQEIIFLHIG
jgi:hypothetical protein